MTIENEEKMIQFLRRVQAAMPNVAQLIDGWLNTPSPEWSEWDKSVRLEVSGIAMEAELLLTEKK